MKLSAELKKLIKGEVATDEKTLHFYSTDASVFRLKPSVVVFPKNVRDIQKLVNFVREHKTEENDLSLTPRSAGTDMTGGPLSESIVMDVNRHLTKIKRITKKHFVSEPGVFYRDLEKETLKHGLVYPSYPASKSIASVGGIVANNSGGELSLRYGTTEDYVEKLKVILQDGNEYTFGKLKAPELKKKLAQKDFEGEVYRRMHALVTKNDKVIKKARPDVSKNSMGYLLWRVWDKKAKTFDLSKIFVGSQGTLGIITEMTLGLVPTENYSRLLVVYLKDIEQVSKVVNEILKFKPTAIESYDDKTLKLAIKFAPQLAALIGKEQSILNFGLEMLPDLWLTLKMGRLPKLVLMAEFNSDDEVEVDTKITELAIALRPYKLYTHIPKNDAEAQKYWVIRRQSFNLLRKKIKDKQTVPFIDDIIVKPEYMPEFLPKLDAILKDYPQMISTVAGHAGNGNFHIIPLMDMTDPNQREIIQEVAEKVYKLVFSYGGSISGEHNSGLIRGPYLKEMFGEEVYKLFKEVKEIFDPKDIFNPHKNVDADLKYSFKFIKTDNEHAV